MKFGVSLKNAVKWSFQPDGKTFCVIRVIYAAHDGDSSPTDVEEPYDYCGQSRWKSPARLESAIKDACSGLRACWPIKYVEVLEWREDGVYPYPETCYSYYKNRRSAIQLQAAQQAIVDVIHSSRSALSEPDTSH